MKLHLTTLTPDIIVVTTETDRPWNCGIANGSQTSDNGQQRTHRRAPLAPTDWAWTRLRLHGRLLAGGVIAAASWQRRGLLAGAC